MTRKKSLQDSLKHRYPFLSLGISYLKSSLTLTLSERNLIRTIFGRDENASKPKHICRRVPLFELCTLIRTIFGRAEVFG